MSNNRDNYWDDEEDDDLDGTTSFDSNDTDLVKKLRKALKQEQRKAKEYETQLGELTKSQKERIIKDALASRGINPKIASFIPNDLDASPEAVNTWLESNADVFGIQLDSKPAVAAEDLSNLQKMDKVLTGAETTSNSDTLEAKLSAATSEEEIMSILSGL
jgi:hypothetical protein